ncbi:MAG: DegQ family serine endoprotease [Panacagrimonas sp.]
MSAKFAFRVVAPLAVAMGAVSFALLTSAPMPAQADISVAAQGQVPSLAPMLKKVMPSVVNISVTAKANVQNPLMQDPFFRRFFEGPFGPRQQPQRPRESQSVGSGVIVDAKKGYVITNNHVVEHAQSIEVRMNDDRVFDAELIGKDPETDIAVLKIKAKGIAAVPLADSEGVEVGDFVVAIGSPFGLRQTVTSGIVSAVGRQTGISEGGYEDFIQTDASINPGNSGGALINLRGELIGIPSNILSRSGGNIGIGFAIPINLARNVMDQLIEHGEVQRGRIGVVGQDLTPDLAKAFGLPNTRGAVVAQVVPDSPAEKAGLKAEDIILEANGKSVQNFAQLRNTVGLMRIGEKVKLKVLRDGKHRKITVTIGKNTEVAAGAEGLHPALAGASFAAVDENSGEQAGVVVQSVEVGSPAARAGLRPKDVILAVNRQRVQSMKDFRTFANSKGQLLLHVKRGNGAMFLLLR